MKPVGRWMGLVGRHLQQHWPQHVVPSAILTAAAIVPGLFAIGLAIVLGGAGAFVQGLAGGRVGRSVGAFGILAVLLVIGAGLVLLLFGIAGYTRYTLLLVRGRRPRLGELWWGFRHPAQTLGLNIAVTLMLLFTGLLLCIPFPFVTVMTLLCYPCLVDGDSAVGAIRRSWRLVVGRRTAFSTLGFVWTSIALLLGNVPIVGLLAWWAIVVSVPVVVYVDLVPERGVTRVQPGSRHLFRATGLP